MPSKEEVTALLERYTVETREIVTTPKYWNTLEIDILLDGKKIGGYERNLSGLAKTFVPFFQGDSIYALYSPDYTATRLMRLPDCVDIGGEEPNGAGFCPIEFYVPYEPEWDLIGQQGFVSGCVWGDDSSWKIQHLDLTEAAQGIVKRSERFGYIELPHKMTLRDAIRLDEPEFPIEITCIQRFDLATGKIINPLD